MPFENIAAFHSPEAVAVPPPSVALVHESSFSWPDDLYWTGPRAAGSYEVYNALVDRSNRVGAWSRPARMTVGSGWMLWGAGWNQPVSYEALGLVWKVRCLALVDPRPDLMLQPGQERVFGVSKRGTGPASIGSHYPWGRLTPHMERLSLADGHYPLRSLRMDGDHVTVAPPPIIRFSSLRNVRSRFVYQFVTTTGETSASPPVTCEQAGSGETVERSFRRAGQPAVAGALGYRVYVQYDGETIWRQAACGGDGWYEIDNYAPIVDSLVAGAPTRADHVRLSVAGETSTSVLDPLNVALTKTSGDIVIPDGTVLETTQPVVDRYDPAAFGRTIGRLNGGQWRLVPKFSQQNQRGPAVIIQNQRSHWQGMHLAAEKLPLATGIAFTGYNEGCAFGVKLSDCMIDMDQVGQFGRCVGIKVAETGAGGSRAGSELILERCGAGATNPYVFEHKQTANVILRDCSAAAFLGAGRMSWQDCVMWISSPNQFQLQGIFHCDCPSGTIFAVEEGYLTVDHLFVDRGCVTLIDFPDYKSGAVTIRQGAVNFVRYDTVQHSNRPANLVRAGNTLRAEVSLGHLKAGTDPVAVTVNGELTMTRHGKSVSLQTYDVLKLEP